MIIYSINNLPKSLTIGRQTETGVTQIGFDCAEWLSNWSNLKMSVMVTPPNGNSAYRANTQMRGSVLVWMVNDADTLHDGKGTVEILGEADGLRKLSAIVNITILPTTTATTTEPPENLRTWYDDVIEAARSGGYYYPNVSNAGMLTWTPSKDGLPFPDAVNIKGPAGARGETPTIETSKVDGVTTVTFKTSEMTTFAQIRDGATDVTAENIAYALGYTPADEAMLNGNSVEKTPSMVWTSQKYVEGSTGDIGSGVSAYDYVELDVTMFTRVKGRAYFNNTAGYGFYDSNGVCIECGLNTKANTYNFDFDLAVPEGAVIMRLSHRNDRGYTINIVGVLRPLFVRVAEVEKRVGSIETAAVLRNTPTIATAESLANNSRISIDAPNTKSGNVITFTAKVTEMSTVIVGHGSDPYCSGSVRVRPTLVEVRKVESSGAVVIETFNHGLTFTSLLSVIIRTKGNNTADVVLVSDNGSYKIDNVEWLGSGGAVYGTGVSGIYTDCRLSYYCADVGKPVWVFGDSYLSQWNVYAVEYGAENWLNDSYPGRNSSQVTASLEKLLKQGTPKTIVWAMGMNDQEDVSWGLSQWQTGYEAVKAVCTKHGIELVLVTIPNTPTRTNTAKNDIIRASGFRYVDIAEEVGASASGASWYTGLLSGDNVHPTELGQRVIAAKMIADVPEMMG